MAVCTSRSGAHRTQQMSSQPNNHKWMVLSNTTLGMLAATINASIVLISLQAIFRGIGLRPLDPGNTAGLPQR